MRYEEMQGQCEIRSEKKEEMRVGKQKTTKEEKQRIDDKKLRRDKEEERRHN